MLCFKTLISRDRISIFSQPGVCLIFRTVSISRFPYSLTFVVCRDFDHEYLKRQSPVSSSHISSYKTYRVNTKCRVTCYVLHELVNPKSVPLNLKCYDQESM